jgi:hypothetical protein
MHIVATPEAILRKQENDPETLQTILDIQMKRAQTAIQFRKADISDEQVCDVIQCIEEFARIYLTGNECTQFIEMFPELRGNIIESGIDSETRDLILNCLCNLLIGCDFRDDETLIQLVRAQAAKLWPRGG